MIINICLIVVIIITGITLASYNHFVRTNNRVNQSASAIDVLLNQRFDLLPNLIECVKGYSKHESETLEELVKLRSSYNKDGFSINETEKLDKKFGNIMAIAESYPDLKANQNFMDLQASLKEIEEKIRFARQFYNDTVMTYQNKIEMFPSNIVANIFGFKPMTFFEATEEERKNVQVKF